jgi:GNAT superfamily N-acetyltransferase
VQKDVAMQSDVIIRTVREADFDNWLPLWSGYNTFYGRTGGTALPEDITRATWRRFHDPAEPMHALVAESDGRLLGLAHYLFHRSTISIGPSCYLQDLFTDASARGRGVGRALIEAVYDAARSASAPRVYWQTHESNRAAMALYDQVAEKSGFVVYRRQF